jgi:predicted RNA-binding protein YlqC (UPF0109 family)
MENKKLETFLISGEFYDWINKIDEFLKIDPNKDIEKDLNIAIVVYKYFFEKLSGENLINYLKEKINWLSEEKFQELLEFIVKNLSQRREELWQKEKKEEIEESISPEGLEERERRYFELMKTVIKKPETFVIKKEKKEEQKFKIEVPETTPVSEEKQITIKWEEEKPQEINLPSETIIIRSKKEEKKEKDEDVIDLSQL